MAHRLAAGPTDFTGIVAYNDNAAAGALDALIDAGLHVPRDVSVVGNVTSRGADAGPS